MKRIWLLIPIAVIFWGCPDDDPAPAVTDLLVAEVTAAPTVDGVGSDAAWNSATELKLTLGEDAAHADAFGAVDISLKAVRTATDLYIKAVWSDPSGSENVDKNQWHYGAEGWEKSGNEDRLFLMFDAGNGSEGADCSSMCHVAEGAMSTTGGGNVDVWHVKAARSLPVGCADDKWWSGDGRGSDSKTIGAYSDNKQTLADGSVVPKYSGPITDGHFIIVPEGETAESYCTLFDTLSTSGEFPGYILNENRDGSRFADVEGSANFSNGTWTVELKRALDTGHDDDVAFAVGQNVEMTVAITDNSGGDHSGTSPFLIKF